MDAAFSFNSLEHKRRRWPPLVELAAVALGSESEDDVVQVLHSTERLVKPI